MERAPIHRQRGFLDRFCDRGVGVAAAGDVFGGGAELERGHGFGRPDSRFEPVDEYAHETTKTWTLWTKTWRPRQPGIYDIELAIDDPLLPTRRLDSGYYTRSVTIHEV